MAAGCRLARKARLAYVTPGHQAPLGAVLPVERRARLLAWARAQGAYLIEGDYDSEHRYAGRPIPALQGLDRDGLVVHTGTFSKTLLSSLRLAYAVVPEALLPAFIAAKSIVDRFTPPLSQAVLADFLEAGHYDRHLRRTREIYAERRAALLGALAAELADLVEVLGAPAGLDTCVLLQPGVDDRAVERELARRGVETLALSQHAIAPPARGGLLLGFAAFVPARLRHAVTVLREVLRRR